MTKNGFVNVYIMDTEELADADAFRRLYDYLPAFRRQKVDCIVSEDGKRESAAAFYLLIHGLEELGLVDITIKHGIITEPDMDDFFENKLGLSFNENGKPYFAARQDIFFSISHTKGCAVCAISDEEVGCDVERIRAVSDKEIKRVDGIVNRFFNSKEKEYLLNTSDESWKVERFYRLWTMKEAYIKYTGRGMGQDISSFCVLDDSCKVTFETKVESGFAYTICTENTPLIYLKKTHV